MIGSQLLSDKDNFHFIERYGLHGFWIFDLVNKDIVYINSLLVSILGFNPDSEKEKEKCKELLHKSLNPDSHHFSNSKNLQSSYLQEYTANDQKVNFTISLKHVTYEEKNYIIGCHVLNETEVLNSLYLNSQLSRYKFIVDGTDIGTWEWNVQTGETIFNEKWSEIIGYSLNELGKIDINTWLENCHPDDLILSGKLLEEHFEGKSRIYDCEARMKHKDGSWVWVQAKGKVVTWTKDGKPEWMAGSHQEITERVISREQNRRFVDQAPIAIAMFNKKIEYLAASQTWKSDYGIENQEIIGKSHYEIFPEIGDEWKKDHQRALKGETLKSDGELFVREDGTNQWIKWELRPWYYKDSEIGGITMYTQDITENKEAEEKLRISEETFRNNFENSAIGMAMVLTNGSFSKANTALCKILGYKNEDLIQLSFQDITHPEDLNKDLSLLLEVVNNERDSYQMEKRYFHKNGSLVYVILSVSVVRKADKSPLYFISQITDITPRFAAQNKLKETLSKLESVVNGSANVSIIGTDLSGKINLFNIGAENLLGYKENEMLGIETPAIIHKQSEIDQRGIELSLEFNKDITGFNVFTEIPEQKGFETREWTYIKKNGEEFTVFLTVNPIRDNNKTIGYIGIAVDISQIKEAEIRIKKLLNITQEQNDRFSNFAYIVSHNLKTHTNNLNGLINLYVKQNPEKANDKVFNFLNQSINGLSETVEHLNQVLTINSNNIELQPIKIYNVIQNTIDNLLINAQKADVKIFNDVDKDLKVFGINAYVESICFNLISNAIKYRSTERDSYLNIKSAVEKTRVIIEFTDNGLGINLAKYKSKLFGMYNTFHRSDEARGIGLFITKNQIHSIGGEIDVISEENKGSTFKVTFQIA